MLASIAKLLKRKRLNPKMLSKIKSLCSRFSVKKILALAKNDYAKNASTLMIGTTLGMLITLVASPWLSRHYSNEAFGALQLYQSTYSILIIIATLRYEYAIMLPKAEKDAFSVLLCSLTSTAIFSVLCGLFVSAVFGLRISLFGLNEFRWLLYMPVTVLVLGIYYSCNYWLNRRKRYVNLAVNRIVQNGLTVVFSVLFSSRYWDVEDGMILAYLLSMVVGTVLFLVYVLMDFVRLHIHLSFREISAMFKRYRRFPLNTMPTGLINTVAVQVPVFILQRYFGEGVVGQYYMMNRVLGTPITVVGQAIADVFRQKASATYAQKGECYQVYKSTAKALALLAIVPFGLLAVFATPLFRFVLGDGWEMAGVFVTLLTPFYYIRLIVSPLTFMSIVAEKQRFELLWQSSLFVLTSLAMLVSCQLFPPVSGFNLSAYFAMSAYGLVYMLMYGYHFTYTRRLAKGQQLWG